MSPLQSAHPLPKSELLPLLPTHWPHDHCHQGIHWVLMVRHTRMQQWLSLCHLGAMVGKLLNSIPTAYVYHDKLVTYGFTLVIWGKPPIYTHTLCLQLHLICLAVFLFLYPNKDIFGGNPPHLFLNSFLRANSVWNGKSNILLQCGQNNKGEILISFSVNNIISLSERCTSS